MKNPIRILSALLALGMMLFSFGCQKDAEPVSPSASPDASASPAVSASADRDAIAVRLGEIEITAGEIEDTYANYMQMFSYYGMSAPTDDASIAEYIDMAVRDRIYAVLPQWVATQKGIALTEQERKEADTLAHDEADEEYKAVVLFYASSYADAGEVESVSELSEEQLNTALDKINEEIRAAFDDPNADFDVYLADIYDMSYRQHLSDAYTKKLRAEADAAVAVTDEQVETWYADTLADQKESFDTDPTLYRLHRDSLTLGEGAAPLLYAPEGLVSIRLITVAPEGELPASVAENEAKLAALEAEYGKLLLASDNEERIAEIKAEYEALRAETDQASAGYYGPATEQINALKARLDGGEDFASVAASVSESAALERVLYLGGEDDAYPAVVRDAVAALKDGEASEVLSDEDGFYLVERIGTLAAGETDREPINDAIREAALLSARDAAWEEQLSAWEDEANAAAVRFPETYAHIGR